jgi:hypothetical protein
MRVGLIAEGRGDLAVLVNILKGKLGLDFEDVQFIRPEYDRDETDLHDQTEAQRGGWVRVKNECTDRTRIREFVQNAIDDEILVVIHIDTAEAHLKGYDVPRPSRDAEDYPEHLRALVAAKIDEWLDNEALERVRHAVAVEETEAWVLTIYSKKDTCQHGDPKKALRDEINRSWPDKERKRHFQRREYDQAYDLTKPFRKPRELAECATRNISLRLFVDSLPPRPPER